MNPHPFGPLSAQEFQEAVDAPFGKAAGILRKHDPLWGRLTGEKIKWRVKLSRTIQEIGYATVEAATKEEADKLAGDLADGEIVWDFDSADDDGVVESIEPL